MIATLALIAVLTWQAPAAAPTTAPAAARIDVTALLEPIRARHDLPGMSAAILDASGAIASGACGVRERGSEAALLVDDKMHLGSCTKSMTATLCAKLVERGELKWTTTIGESFADWGDAVDASWKPVTLAQLLTHRGGAPATPEAKVWMHFFTSEDAPRAQREQLARSVFAHPLTDAPGTKFVYSNAGISIAGLMAERCGKPETGRDFEDLIRAELFTPLGMTSAGFGPPGTPGKLDEPVGHRADGGAVGWGVGSDNPPAITPAGRVHCSIGDWAKYAALHLRGPREGGLDISKETFARTHTPPDDGLSPYAMGWNVEQRPWGGRVLTHSGSNTMWYCVAWLAPEKGFGVLIATNQGGDAAVKGCDEAAGALIRAWGEARGTARGTAK